MHGHGGMDLTDRTWLLQGDEAELAKKIAALKWHGKEMEVRPNHFHMFHLCI